MSKFYFDYKWRTNIDRTSAVTVHGVIEEVNGGAIAEVKQYRSGRWEWEYYAGGTYNSAECDSKEVAILNVDKRLERDEYKLADEKFRPLA